MLTKTASRSQVREAPIARQPVSQRIRERLVASGQRFHANDNIAAHLEHGELDELRGEVQKHLQAVLRSLVIDIDNDHNTRGTAQRVAKMFVDEVFAGRYVKAPAITEFPNASRLDEPMVIGPIMVRSACSHHLCPVVGRVWIGVLPNASTNLIGLSKYARLCEWVMSRPQIQEEAVKMLANELQARVQPDGLAIVMEAVHYCMHWRGVKDPHSAMTSCVMLGAFKSDSSLRAEVLSLMRLRGRPD